MARRQITGRLNLNEVEYISQAGRDVVTETIGKEMGGLGQALGAAFEKAFKHIWYQFNRCIRHNKIWWKYSSTFFN